MNFNVRIKGLDSLIDNVERAGVKFVPVMQHALADSVRVVHKRARKNAPEAFGKLRGGIRREVRNLTGIVETGEKGEYAVYVEKGTRPHMPPVEPLKKWADLKLGDAGLGYAVARKIAREGTEAQPFMEPALEDSVSDIERAFEKAADDLVRIMAR